MVKHITIAGDTWDYIAYKYYGNEYLLGALITANPKYADVDILPAGVEVVIPQIEYLNRKKLEPIW